MTAATLIETAAASGFAADLRVATQAIHREAERAGHVADLIRGRATPRGYALYLRSLLPVYEALEARLSEAHRSVDPSVLPALRAFADPALFRAGALRADIETITGAPAEDLPLLDEATAYAALMKGEAAGLVGHAYARYLGDLSGGQILKPLLAKTLGLGADALQVYAFSGLSDLNAAKAALREGLDSVSPGSPEACTIRAAALDAFRHTIDVSTAVARAAT